MEIVMSQMSNPHFLSRRIRPLVALGHAHRQWRYQICKSGRGFCCATVLPAENVIDLAAPDQPRFIHQAILATPADPHPDFAPQLLANDVSHARLPTRWP